jgi:hypothetical protein
MATGAFIGIPFLGPALDAIATQAIAKDKGSVRAVSIRSAPVFAVYETIARAAEQDIRWIASGKEPKDADRYVWEHLEALGLMAGMPVRQVRRTGEYFEHLITGQEELDLLTTPSGVIYGKRKKQSTTPFTAAREVVTGRKTK